MNNRVLVAMSGGVDSSVAAYLLKVKGFDCVGVTMRLFDNALLDLAGESTCCSVEDVQDAASVCARLDIPHVALDLSKDFRALVIDKFAGEYRRGRTPNPCIDCNRYMKFSRLLDYARQIGCDRVATGHYVRRVEPENGPALMKAADLTKDQSYVLACLTQEQLRRALFPLGELTKEEVRHIAAREGFLNARKKDSQDICFVPDGDYLSFLERYTGQKSQPGALLDEAGRVLGVHRGAAGYTVGQRHGLGIAAERPLYVKSKDMEKNTVTVSFAEGLYARSCLVTEFNWITKPPCLPVRGAARTRYRQAEQPCTAERCDGGVRLTFDAPQRAMTPGQAAVLYDGALVLGGGTIDAVFEEV